MTNAIEFNFKTAKDSGIVILNRENKKHLQQLKETNLR